MNQHTPAPRLSLPGLLVRLEGLAALIASVIFYGHSGQSWWLFGLLLLSPDLAMAGYALNPRIGSLAYNAVHTYAGPLLLGLAGFLAAGFLWGAAPGLALIWFAHIGMDRALGYGLKYPGAFKDTHLQRI